MVARALAVLLVMAAAAGAQQVYVGPSDIDDPSWATPKDFDGSVPFCRGYYESTRYEANGGGWKTDYPGADINFLVRLRELTTVRAGKPVVVRLDSPLLFNCPLLYMSDVGTMGLRESEVLGLRAYLRKGGLLWADDFWGTEAWDQWMREIRQVLPTETLIAIPATHPVFHQLYSIDDGIWQMPTTGIWPFLDEDGNHVTSERGADSATAHMRALLDARSRVVVLMTHNTDIADGWEAAEQAENLEYFGEFSSRSYALGVNVLLYLLTH